LPWGGFTPLPNIPHIAVMFWPQVSHRMLLTFVLIFRLILVNNKELMGDYINPRTFNVTSWVTVVIMIVFTRWLVVTSFFPS